MAETTMNACSYWVVRYTPNLIRDEWMNVGVLLLDPARPRFRSRFIHEDREFGRVKKLFPDYDEQVLRGLDRHFDATVGGAENPVADLAKLGETLSNVVQLSAERGLLTEDFEAELDRLYGQHVAPPPRRPGIVGRAVEFGRGFIRTQLNDLFRRAGISSRLQRHVRIEEFTYAGDPMRIDFTYRRNGTRGFVHAVSLERDSDAALAKEMAYTAARIRERLASAEFTVVTDASPRPENDRHQFVARLLADQEIALLPVARLEPWVNDLRRQLLQ